MDKINDLDVNIVLPGHRTLMNNHRQRIIELKQHHQQRLNEVIRTLKDSEKTAYEVAPYITWNIKAKSWQDFPPPQKWFAFGETLAHLHYLEAEGKIRSFERDNKLFFSLV